MPSRKYKPQEVTVTSCWLLDTPTARNMPQSHQSSPHALLFSSVCCTLSHYALQISGLCNWTQEMKPHSAWAASTTNNHTPNRPQSITTVRVRASMQDEQRKLARWAMLPSSLTQCKCACSKGFWRFPPRPQAIRPVTFECGTSQPVLAAASWCRR